MTMAKLSTTKLIIVAVLGLCALVLGSVVLTLQSYGVGEKRRRQAQEEKVEKETSFTSIQSSNPTSPRDLHLAGIRTSTSTTSHAFPPPDGAQWTTVGEAYWRHAAAFLKDWDVLLEDDDGFMIPSVGDYSTTTATTNRNNATSSPRLALELAAQAGHPLAQLYLANAHASGIWPVTTLTNERARTRTHTSMDTAEEEELHVFDEWTPTAHGDHPQVTKAFVLWHMAAMAGSIDAAMALAYRIDNDDDDVGNANANSKCTDVLPYYEAAANGILDELESSLHSRAKVLPPMDRHTLAQVHMHGGTSSQLHWHDKPDEPKEALQFYHLKATTIPWSMTSSSSDNNNGDDKDKASTKEAPIDVNAAFTLGHLYQHGVRGVEQNLTLSLQYYEIAASYGHWESAGEAGTFHLWGMGTPQNVHEALTFFRLGAPPGMDGCKRRHDQMLMKLSQSLQSQSDEDLYGDVVECDHQSLNGLGLLHLLGIPGKLEVDLPMAEKLFTLAKEMGNADAMYNLAMMWLGWKTHYKRVEDLKEDGMSHNHDHGSAVFLGSDKGEDFHANTPPQTFALHISQTRSSGNEPNFKGPTRAEIQEAIKSLTTAANKGHVQAKHRLGMIYAEGIQIQTTASLTHHAVKKDCNKARGLFQWIAENASMSRSKRLRKAYKEYIAGDLETSVRNYLAAAETGSSAGQVNAAFLFERGTCLGLAPADCAKASVRLWKAAAARGHAEACLRVGDFYYYGRLRGNTLPTGPFGWVQYVLYPEEYIPQWIKKWGTKLGSQVNLYRRGGVKESEGETESETETKVEQEDTKDEEELVEADLAMAAHYYTVAVEKHHSPRANFNLGFMHEWGFGLKQDFPLAKRHYDLAASSTVSNEADLAVQIALMAMNSHETFVKSQVAFDDWWNGRGKASKKKTNTVTEAIPESPPAEHQGWHPVPDSERITKTQQGVILSHLFNWSSLVIVVLLYVVHQLMQFREHQRRR